MRIAIFGATSQIAKDLVRSFAAHDDLELSLYARRPDAVSHWLSNVGLEGRFAVAAFTDFHTKQHFDAILNFVGVGDPAQAAAMGASIFDITLQYDELALHYVRQHPTCRYLFLSSGAAYGSNFDVPADENTKALIAINHLKPQDWYGVAKLHAECRHRALQELSIIDIRVFNYFSHTQNMAARFLMTDIVRAIQENKLLSTSADYIVRDFIHPSDFAQLINTLLHIKASNFPVDCYSKAPLEKPHLLIAIQNEFGLQYETNSGRNSVNATGGKPFYYSLNKQAAKFGYDPVHTSLDGILKELHLTLGSN